MTTLNIYRCPSGDYLLSPASSVLSAERLAVLDYLGFVSLEAFDDVLARNLLTQIEASEFAILTPMQFRSGRPQGAACDRLEGESDP
ncbi:hypothetical protein [Noviluteimonas dokdonensis]|uniref:hypothetical protein n=1 Tax=Noviluteimonas dokdonensis TaxID=414050 RepID=UPI001269B207|nr:hypothetical protein [Lysobacter dokdonensis]